MTLRADPDAVVGIPAAVARWLRFVPVECDETTVTVAVSDLTRRDRIEAAVHGLTGRRASFVIVPPTEVVVAQARVFGHGINLN